MPTISSLSPLRLLGSCPRSRGKEAKKSEVRREMATTSASLLLSKTPTYIRNPSSSNSVFYGQQNSSLVLQRRRSSRKRLNCRCLFGLGVPELAVIGGAVLLVFGPSKLPDVGKTIGKTFKGFQQAAKEFETELQKPSEDSVGLPEEEVAAVNGNDKKDIEVSNTKQNI